MTRSAWGVAVVLACGVAACEDPAPLLPVSPSEVDANLAQQVASQWSPYVGVQPDADALPAYREELIALRRSGHLRGVRMEIVPRFQHPVDPVIKAVGGLGIDVLALIGNEYLFEDDIEQEVDRIFANYPEVQYFQVGNEVTTILPPSGPTITIDEYMQVFQRVYDHVQQRHPGRAVLLTQSTLGSGLRGPTELERMAHLGLAAMDPNRVIVAVNAYDPDVVGQYRGLLGSTLRMFRVWVTESGVPDEELHIPFVREQYPLLRNYLRAERVYWYTLWGGDTGPDVRYGLLRNPRDHPRHWRSPLLDLLTGRL